MKFFIYNTNKEIAAQIENYIYEERELLNKCVEIDVSYSINDTLKILKTDEWYDLLYLGINNFDEDVFRIASIIRNKYKTKGPEIIFTDYDTTECHKLFKYEPLNFYCYPIRKEIIKVDIEKIFNRVNKEENEVLKFHYDGITKGVSFDEIIYIEAKGNNSEIYKKDGNVDNATESISKIESRVKTEGFIKCHRSYIANLKYIEGYSHNKIYIEGGYEIPIGRTYAKELKKIIFK